MSFPDLRAGFDRYRSPLAAARFPGPLQLATELKIG